MQVLNERLEMATPAAIQIVQDMLAQQWVKKAIAGHSTGCAWGEVDMANEMADAAGKPIHSVVGVIV